ncbi:MAG: LPS-assembly protein LptD [Candidatus Polarisedimenticolia bacterium]
MCAAVLCLAAGLVASAAAPAAPEGTGTEASPAGPADKRRIVSEGPGGVPLEIAAGPGSIFGRDELILKEYVDILYGDLRLQADFVRYVPSTKEAAASGNVILDHGSARITAESLTYNLETGTGTFYTARGYAEPSYYFEAERIEKVSENELVLHEAMFTACTQPIPYWSFRIGHGLLRLGDYAYLHNLSFRVGRVPVFFTPYLVWPIKTDRASGLLFPEFGFSRRGGTVVSNAFYWAIRRNMDATFFLDYMSQAGYGTGLEFRYVPSETGRGHFTGYHIRDQIAKEERRAGDDVPIDRWVINYGHDQEFGAGWRLVASASFISDFDYYLDFERDLRLSTNPQAISNLFLTRNWGFYSLNLRGERREQLLSVPVAVTPGDPLFLNREETIVRWIRPDVELRGRRQRLGRAPLFLSLESSASSFNRGGTERGEYQRVDLFPVFSTRLSPLPWMDVDASAGYRSTLYTRSQGDDLGCDNEPGTGDPGEGNGLLDAETDLNFDGIFDAAEDIGCDGLASTGDAGEGDQVRNRETTVILDDGVTRGVFTAGLTFVGPKMSRVFDRPASDFSTQYKHTIEPQVRYAYRSAVADPDRIIRFDDVDLVSGDTNRVTFALVTRLFAKRPMEAGREVLPGVGLAGTAYVGGGADPYTFLRQVAGERAETEDDGEVTPPASGEAAPGAGGPGETGAGTPAAGAPPAPKQRLGTVEVASLEISQDYSFLGPLSLSSALGTATQPLDSRFSPVRATLRFNPSARTSLDLRTTWDILFRTLRETSLSANLRSTRRGFLDFTWSWVRDLEGEALAAQNPGFIRPFDRNQIGILGETSLLNRRLLLGLQANYELGDISPGEPRLRDQRYKVGYNTQCCGFQFEVLNRNFLGASQREFRFLVNLKGVGNVIDLQSGSGGALPGTLPGAFGGFQ